MGKHNLIIILKLAILSGLILSVLLLYKHSHESHDFHEISHHLTSIPKDIRYYDEVLTMSAYMASLTHKLEWIDRYDKAVVSIENTISEAVEKFPKISRHIDEIDALGKILIDLERESFKLIRDGEFEEARMLLFSERYDVNKKLYVDKLDEIFKVIESSINNYDQKAEQRLEFLLLMTTLSIILSSILAMVVYIIFNKQNRALLDSKESLDNQYKLLQKIIDSIPTRMFWKDKDGVYLGANQGFIDDAELTDISQIIGKTDFDMTWRQDAERFRADDMAVIASGVPRLQYEEEQPKEDGSSISLLTSKVPLRDIHDNIIGILGIYDDITEQKRLEQERLFQDEQIFKQARHAQMGEMIAMIAHQWRQPLAAISATVASLHVQQELHGYNQKSFDEQLNNISKYTQHLSSTIDDFRNFFKDEKEKVNISLKSVVDDSLSIIGDILKSKGIEVRVECLNDDKISTYQNELKQVILNILRNAQEVIDERAIKEASIDIKIYKADYKYCIEIKDNAGGIPKNIIDQIFEAYFTTKGKLNGTGLGLHMSKTIVEKHMHGNLHVKNVDKGASFTIELENIDE